MSAKSTCLQFELCLHYQCPTTEESLLSPLVACDGHKLQYSRLSPNHNNGTGEYEDYELKGFSEFTYKESFKENHDVSTSVTHALLQGDLRDLSLSPRSHDANDEAFSDFSDCTCFDKELFGPGYYFTNVDGLQLELHSGSGSGSSSSFSDFENYEPHEFKGFQDFCVAYNDDLVDSFTSRSTFTSASPSTSLSTSGSTSSLTFSSSSNFASFAGSMVRGSKRTKKKTQQWRRGLYQRHTQEKPRRKQGRKRQAEYFNTVTNPRLKSETENTLKRAKRQRKSQTCRSACKRERKGQYKSETVQRYHLLRSVRAHRDVGAKGGAGRSSSTARKFGLSKRTLSRYWYEYKNKKFQGLDKELSNLEQTFKDHSKECSCCQFLDALEEVSRIQ